MAYLNPTEANTILAADFNMAPGWAFSEFKFGASPTVTTGDVLDTFFGGIAVGYFVADWVIFMEQVDTGTTVSTTFTKELDATLVLGTPGVITSTAHGLIDNTPFVVTAASGTRPTGASLDTTYYVRNATANAFNLASTSGGAAEAFTGASTGIARLNAFVTSNITSYSVAFNVGVAGDSTAISGSTGLRWVSATTELGRTSTISVLRAPNGSHMQQNGHANKIGLQCSTLPATAAWANKRIWMGILLLPTASMGS